jgi:signal transduction histidine kinase
MDKVPYRDENGVVVGVIAFALDITDRKRAEEDIVKSRGQLRDLYQRIEQIREEERSRIAREVHDELGQLLTTLKLEWSLLEKKIGGETRNYPERRELMRDLIDSSMQTVKKISSDLRPPILDVFGLPEAIEWQGKEFQDRTGVLFEFVSDPRDMQIDRERSTTLFRIFQEALTNVARHAEAGRVFASLTCSEGMYILKMEDDGIGINESQVFDSRSLGILGMRERALVWGGAVDIHGVPGKGTTVTIKLSR